MAGNGKGKVGVGCCSHKEVMGAVAKAVREAKANLIEVPLTKKEKSIPHRNDVTLGAAKVHPHLCSPRLSTLTIECNRSQSAPNQHALDPN